MDSLFEEVYKIIRTEIIRGNWKVYERINEKELADILHVSRTPLRKALKKICDEGLLEYTKNLGYQVKMVSKEDVIEIYKIRIALEKLAFSEASKKLNKAHIDDINNLLELSRNAVEVGDHEKLIYYSNEFNEYIYHITNMPKLIDIQIKLQNYLARFRQISFSGDKNDRSLKAVEEHEAIFGAMLENNFALLDELIENHLAKSCDYIVEIVVEENKNFDRYKMK